MGVFPTRFAQFGLFGKSERRRSLEQFPKKANPGYSPQPAFEDRWGDKAHASVERGKATDLCAKFQLSRLAALDAKGRWRTGSMLLERWCPALMTPVRQNQTSHWPPDRCPGAVLSYETR
jgi:hypothetical protein